VTVFLAVKLGWLAWLGHTVRLKYVQKEKGQSTRLLQKTRIDVWTLCAWILLHFYHCKGEIAHFKHQWQPL